MTRKRTLGTFLLIIVLVFLGVGGYFYLSNREESRALAELEANKGKVDSNLTYCNMDGTDMKLDLYYPTASIKSPAPVVVYIHGGGWVFGDKSLSDATDPILSLREHGYYLASISYRLAPDHKFPAQIVDSKCAIRYLKANSGKYHFDTDKFVAAGFSAGGHLALLLGTTDKEAGFDQGQYLEESSQVHAVISAAGPTDLGADELNKLVDNKLVAAATDSTEEDKAKASPVKYVDKSDAPTYLVHGDADNVVPISQSELMHKALQEAGVPVHFEVVKGGKHAIPATIDTQSWTEKILDFLNSHI